MNEPFELGIAENAPPEQPRHYRLQLNYTQFFEGRVLVWSGGPVTGDIVSELFRQYPDVDVIVSTTNYLFFAKPRPYRKG